MPARDGAARDELVCTIVDLMRIARLLLDSEADARSAVQAAYATRASSWPLGDVDHGSLSHLRRTTVRECLARRRQRRPAMHLSIDALLPKFLPDGHQVAPARCWQMGAAQSSGPFFGLLRAKIDELPPRHGEVLLLCDLLAFDADETAVILGSTPQTIRQTRHRAHQALRTLLEPHCAAAPTAG